MGRVETAYNIVEQLSDGIARILARNPSAYTYNGTQTYLLGQDEIAVIDPGPDLEEHIEEIIKAIGQRRLSAILCTHTHRDHSPASRPLSQRTGAPIIGCAPLVLEAAGPRADASFDPDYAPDRILEDDEFIVIDGNPVTAVATPGHTSNHLCYSYRDALFTGDHVMGWSTTVVAPPDGDMAAYIASLEKLLRREDRIYHSAHGAPVTDPHAYVWWLLEHRRERERQILAAVEPEPISVEAIVRIVYPDLDSRLIAAAGGSVLAHLLDLQRRGLVEVQEEQWKTV
jgi:glyoxylase-like metal-dependent hydrolase (beta-lactamase superfamily II)